MDFLFLVLLILLNGVFALSEMAIVSSRRPRLQAMADRGSTGAKTALKLLDDPSKLLSTVQIGITAIGVIAGAYGATSLSDNFSPWIEATFPGVAKYAPSCPVTPVIKAIRSDTEGGFSSRPRSGQYRRTQPRTATIGSTRRMPSAGTTAIASPRTTEPSTPTKAVWGLTVTL